MSALAAYAVAPDGLRWLLGITLGAEGSHRTAGQSSSSSSWSKALAASSSCSRTSTRAWPIRYAASCPRLAASAAPCTCNATSWPRSRIACANVWRARLLPSSGLAEAKKRLADVTARWHKELPEAMQVLEQGFTAQAQCYAFPEPHWARLRTTNGLERLTPRSSAGSAAPVPSPTEPVRSAFQHEAFRW